MNINEEIFFDSRTLRAGIGVYLLSTILFFCLMIQLFLDCSVFIVILCAISIAITTLPITQLGRDIYTTLCLILGLRYTGIALIAKTVYGESIDDNLKDPLVAFFLTDIILLLYTTAILFSRRVDNCRLGKFFPRLPPERLHLLAQICLLIGGIANFISGLNKSTTALEQSHGAVFVISSAVSGLFYAGIAAEVISAIHKSDRKEFITPTLAFGMISILMLSALTNTREFLASCIVTIFLIAFIYGAIARRHVIIGLFFVAFFVLVISPFTLFVRANKEGLRTAELVSLIATTATRAVSDPGFYDRLIQIQSNAGLRDDGAAAEYNYYQQYSNVLNRLSYVALIDHIYDNARHTPPLGAEAFADLVERLMPSFIIKKSNINYSYTDFLAWQIGAEDYDINAAVNFSLPMAGLVVWGYGGLISYVLFFPTFLFFIFNKLNSIRSNSVASFTMFSISLNYLVEASEDGYFLLLTRPLPIALIFLIIVYKFVTPAPGVREAHFSYYYIK